MLSGAPGSALDAMRPDANHFATALLWKEMTGADLVTATHDAALALGAPAYGLRWWRRGSPPLISASRSTWGSAERGSSEDFRPLVSCRG